MNNANRPVQPDIPTRAEAIVLLRYRDSVLLLREKGSDEWTFISRTPGRGDSLKACCQRGLKEMTGLEIRDRALLPYNVYYDTVKKIAAPVRRAASSVRFVYQAWQLKMPDITPGPGTEEYRFVPISDLGTYKVAAPQMPIVKDLIAYNGEAVRRFGPEAPEEQ